MWYLGHSLGQAHWAHWDWLHIPDYGCAGTVSPSQGDVVEAGPAGAVSPSSAAIDAPCPSLIPYAGASSPCAGTPGLQAAGFPYAVSPTPGVSSLGPPAHLTMIPLAVTHSIWEPPPSLTPWSWLQDCLCLLDPLPVGQMFPVNLDYHSSSGHENTVSQLALSFFTP